MRSGGESSEAVGVLGGSHRGATSTIRSSPPFLPPQPPPAGKGRRTTDPTAIELAQLEKEIHALEQEDELDLMRQLYLEDYRSFLHECLGLSPEAIPPMGDPGVLQYHEEAGDFIRHWLATRHTQQTFKKMMVVVPRECCKSTGITAASIPFANIHDPNIACAISSANDDMAIPFGRVAKAHLEGQYDPELPACQRNALNELFGPFRQPQSRRKWTEDEAITDTRRSSRKDPTLKIFSVQTGGTSGHFDLVVLDDPVTEELITKYGEGWYDKCWAHYVSLGYVVRKDGLFILVCTRYGDRDLVGRIIETEIEPTVRKRTLLGAPPGKLPDDFEDNWFNYAHLAGWKVIFREVEDDEGNLCFPDVWPEERIEAEKLKSPVTASSQLYNRPSSREDNPIKQIHIDKAWRETTPKRFLNDISIHCDIAWGSQDNFATHRKKDYNVIWAVGQDGGQVAPVWGWFDKNATQEEFGTALIRCAQWAASEGVKATIRCITMDKPTGGVGDSNKVWLYKLFADAGMMCPRVIELVRGGRGASKKRDRILSTAGYWQDGRVILPKDVPGTQELATQMLTILNPRHDDHADAFSDVFNAKVYIPGEVKEGGMDEAASKDFNWEPAVPIVLFDDIYGSDPLEVKRDPGWSVAV